MNKMFSDSMNLLGCIDSLLKESLGDALMLEQIMWLLGNITGDSRLFRDLIIKNTCILDTLSQVTKGKSISRSFLRTMCWLNANLNRYKGLTPDQIQKSFTLAKEGLFTSDELVVSDSLWAINYMVETENDAIIQFIATADVLHIIIQCLLSPDPTHFIPALKALGSILTTNDHEVIDRCLWGNCLTGLDQLLQNINGDSNYGSISVTREICWALSNITAGNLQ